MNYNQDRDNQYQSDLAKTLDGMDQTLSELEKNFGPGTYGNHEALDRVYLCTDMWADYIQNHPSVLLDKELWNKVEHISMLMYQVYNDIAQKE